MAKMKPAIVPCATVRKSFAKQLWRLHLLWSGRAKKRKRNPKLEGRGE